MIDVHRRLRANFPGLLTLIVPRHPERGAEIATLVADAGLKAALRSAGTLPDAATDVYVCDTVGELGVIYRLAPIVFMGGSLIAHGGQNPIEAIKLGAAILHGPFISNFAEIYAALDGARGADLVGDTERLTTQAGNWLRDEAARRRVVAAGQKTVESLGGALERTLAALDPYLLQLGMEDHA